MVHYAVRKHKGQWAYYDVELMRRIGPSLSTFTISVKDLQWQLALKVWVGSDGKAISPADILSKRVVDEGHMSRILNADLAYEIYVMDETVNWKYSQAENSRKLAKVQMDILDGFHRLAKAFMLEYTELKAKEFTWSDLQKTRIPNPEGDEDPSKEEHVSEMLNSLRTGKELDNNRVGLERKTSVKVFEAIQNVVSIASNFAKSKGSVPTHTRDEFLKPRDPIQKNNKMAKK
jgi:hypothetical protein